MNYPDKMQWFFSLLAFFLWRWHDIRNTYFLGVGSKFAKNFNTSSSFISFIHLFVHPSIHLLFNYMVRTWVPSFISFILLIIGPRFKHVFHLSFHSFIHLFIHPFIYYLTTVRTWVPSFISFILLIIGPRFKHVFHLSFHSFIYSFHPSIHLLFNHGLNMGAIFHFIHFVDYWAKVQTCVPSFISFICLFFSSIHSFII